jgi:hypothetical protein
VQQELLTVPEYLSSPPVFVGFVQIGQPSHGDFNIAKRNPWFSSFLVNSTQKETRNGGVMVSVLASSAVDRGFEHQSGQTKDYKIGICRKHFPVLSSFMTNHRICN